MPDSFPFTICFAKITRYLATVTPVAFPFSYFLLTLSPVLNLVFITHLFNYVNI